MNTPVHSLVRALDQNLTVSLPKWWGCLTKAPSIKPLVGVGKVFGQVLGSFVMRENKFEPELKGVGAPVSSLARSTFNKSFGSLKCSPADGQGDHEPEVGRALRARRPAVLEFC